MRSLSNFRLQQLPVILQSSFERTKLVKSIHVRYNDYNVKCYKTTYHTETFKKHYKGLPIEPDDYYVFCLQTKRHASHWYSIPLEATNNIALFGRRHMLSISNSTYSYKFNNRVVNAYAGFKLYLHSWRFWLNSNIVARGRQSCRLVLRSWDKCHSGQLSPAIPPCRHYESKAHLNNLKLS